MSRRLASVQLSRRTSMGLAVAGGLAAAAGVSFALIKPETTTTDPKYLAGIEAQYQADMHVVNGEMTQHDADITIRVIYAHDLTAAGLRCFNLGAQDQFFFDAAIGRHVSFKDAGAQLAARQKDVSRQQICAGSYTSSLVPAHKL